MSFSSDDLQRIINFGGVKINYKTNTFSPAIYQGRFAGLDAENWLNSNSDNLNELIQKYPDVVRPYYENTQGDSNIFSGFSTPGGALAMLTALFAPEIAPAIADIAPAVAEAAPAISDTATIAESAPAVAEAAPVAADIASTAADTLPAVDTSAVATDALPTATTDATGALPTATTDATDALPTATTDATDALPTATTDVTGALPTATATTDVTGALPTTDVAPTVTPANISNVAQNADNSLTYTFDDGSTMTTDASGNPLSSTNALNPINTTSMAKAAMTGAAKGVASNVVMDAITGQPVTPQGLLTSAATGGVGGVAGNVAGQLGAGTIGSGIAGGTAGGTTGALLNNGDVGQGALTGALTGGISGATNQLLSDQSAPVTAAGQSVATGLTNAALSGNTNNLAQNLVGGALASAGLTSGANALLNPSTPATSNPDDAFNQALVNAMQNPTDTSNNPTYAPLASTGTVTIGSDVGGSTTPLVPTDVGTLNPDGTVTMPDGTINTYDSDGNLISSVPPDNSSPSNDTFVVTPSSDVSSTGGSSPTSGAISGSGGTAVTGGGTTSTPSVTPSSPPVDLTPINNQLSSLSDAQQQAVANQVAMGVSLTTAINNVQSELQTQIGGLQTSLKNQQIAASTPSSTTSSSGGNIPTPISGQSLAGAPVYNTNTQILQQLKQLDPKLLSMIAPHLANESQNTALMQSGLSALTPSTQSTGSQQQSNPYASLLQTMLADKGGSNPTNSLLSSGVNMLSGSSPLGYKDGGDVHKPEFITGATGHYVKGRGDGQSDDIPAMLADGEYVFDADTVAALGNGSSDAGAKLLDHFRESLRAHKRSAPNDKIPPKASPLMYMKEALRKHNHGT